MATLYRFWIFFVFYSPILSGLSGGIWLGVLGDWGVVLLGIAALVVSRGLGLVIALGLIFTAPASVASEKWKTNIGGMIFQGMLLALSTLWTLAVIVAWCVGTFYVVAGQYHTGALWPYLLWAYGAATWSWTYMASRSREFASSLAAQGACVGAIAMIGVSLLMAHPAIIDFLTAFCVPISVVFIVLMGQIRYAISGMKEISAQRYRFEERNKQSTSGRSNTPPAFGKRLQFGQRQTDRDKV